MKTRLGLAAATVLAGAALVLSACATAPAVPDSSGAPSDAPTAPDVSNALEAAWLDNGRMFAVVTWGSSSCVPSASEVTASGQEVTVTLDNGPADAACTADMAPRATVVGLPEGVKPTEDVKITVIDRDLTSTTELDGESALTGAGGQATDYLPSAGWFDDEGLVLLTWGSSTCAPQIENVEETPSNVTVTFKTNDGPCTMDMAPRATIIGLSDAVDDNATLTLVGDNLDGVVTVIGG